MCASNYCASGCSGVCDNKTCTSSCNISCGLGYYYFPQQMYSIPPVLQTNIENLKKNMFSILYRQHLLTFKIDIKVF